MSDNKFAKQSLYQKGILAFEGLKKREQNLLFVIVPLTIIAVCILLLIEPEVKKTIALEKSVDRLQTQLSLSRQSNEMLLAQAQIDPNEPARLQIEKLRNRLTKLNAQFENELNQLISPQAMPALLEQLFDQTGNLTLNSMTSLAPEVLKVVDTKTKGDNEKNRDSATKPGASVQQPIFRHGIKISFEGSFFATKAFLSKAEALGWKLYWQDLSYVVGEHPNAITTLTLFTLSTSEAFIGVN